MLPNGLLPKEFVEFLRKIESLELIHEAHIELIEQNKTREDPETSDWSFESHRSTACEYLMNLEPSWDKLILLESDVMYNLTKPDVSGTPALVFKSRYKDL